MNLRFLMTSLCLATLLFTSCGDDETTTVDCTTNGCPTGFTCDNGVCIEDVDDSIVKVTTNISADETWTSDKCYILGGRITVEDGATLTIEPGTVIKGEAGNAASATALLVARGGKLMAEGTATLPIVFTSVADELTGEDIKAGNYGSPNLLPTQNGLWGGLIVLGYAPISTQNENDEDITEVQIEGIPTSDPNGLYGGTDAADNSGVIRYVSIRHGGTNIGAGNEINGLTLGGVGTGTVIEYVEVVANQDDGIEWFGGSVNTSNALVWNAGDDAIDTDMAWTGTLDNFIVVGAGDACFELDGPEGTLQGIHTITNGTVVAGSNELMDLDPNSGVMLSNIFITGMEEGQQIVDSDAMGAFGGNVSFNNILVDFTDGALDDYVSPSGAAGISAGNTPQADKSAFGWTWAAEAGGLDDL